jgi:ribosomal protein S18 acetylase RimI-like enzyme
MNIRHVLWVEADDSTPIAATMIMLNYDENYRICGLAVESSYQKQGHAKALMAKIDEVLPEQSEVELGVDKGKDSTEWLTSWYERLGFRQIDETPHEIVLSKTVFKDKTKN